MKYLLKALYAAKNDDDKIYLSRGKPTSSSDEKEWENAEPKLLKEKINNRFADADDRQQMKRVIRYLKRWKDEKFKNTKKGKPTGIAITALAYNLFEPEITRKLFSSTVTPNDLKALKNFVQSILNKFSWRNDRIIVKLPVEPHNDLFEKMSDNQQSIFKEKLQKLLSMLDELTSNSEPDPHESSKKLRSHLGNDFPLIEKKDTAAMLNLAFPGKSESA